MPRLVPDYSAVINWLYDPPVLQAGDYPVSVKIHVAACGARISNMKFGDNDWADAIVAPKELGRYYLFTVQGYVRPCSGLNRLFLYWPYDVPWIWIYPNIYFQVQFTYWTDGPHATSYVTTDNARIDIVESKNRIPGLMFKLNVARWNWIDVLGNFWSSPSSLPAYPWSNDVHTTPVNPVTPDDVINPDAIALRTLKTSYIGPGSNIYGPSCTPTINLALSGIPDLNLGKVQMTQVNDETRDCVTNCAWHYRVTGYSFPGCSGGCAAANNVTVDFYFYVEKTTCNLSLTILWSANYTFPSYSYCPVDVASSNGQYGCRLVLESRLPEIAVFDGIVADGIRHLFCNDDPLIEITD